MDHYPTSTSCQSWGGNGLPWGAGHGPGISGIITSNTDNGVGVASVAPNTKIVPIRAYECWAFSSDLADAILWAVGEEIAGLNTNENPADVIEMAMGGPGFFGCPSHLFQVSYRWSLRASAYPICQDL